jgi:mitogen-activated protein kinase organizer 1
MYSSHDNAKFASCGGDKLVFIWDVATAQVTRRLQGHFGKINTVAFNKDAQVLASGELSHLHQVNQLIQLRWI